MKNRVTKSVPELTDKLERAIPGVVKYTAAFGLAEGLAESMTQAITDMTAADTAYEAAKADQASAQSAFDVAQVASRVHATTVRDLFKRRFGTKYSQAWNQLGFNGGVNVPKTIPGLLDVLTSTGGYLTNHADQGNADLNVTAAGTNALRADLLARRTAVDVKKSARGTAYKARSQKAEKARRLLRGLIEDLKQAIDPLDERWVEFGLNRPGAKQIPDVPENVTAVLQGNNVTLHWGATPRAEYFRVWKKVNGVDEELLVVGTRAELDFALAGLPSNSTILFGISAVNNGGESAVSELVTVVT